MAGDKGIRFDLIPGKVEFDYVNWRGQDHHYVIVTESFVFGMYGEGVIPEWHLNGNVVTRDGDIRPEMGPTRRRSFLLHKMRNLRSVPDGS